MLGQQAKLPLIAILGLPLATLVTLFVIPIAITAAYSFWSVNDDYQLVTVLGLDQYRKVFYTPIYRSTLLGSMWLAFLTTVFCAILAVPLALVIGQWVHPRWRVLLIVGHDRTNLTDGTGGPRDPTLLYSPDEIVTHLGHPAANVHFEDHLEAGEIRFDYVMRPGVVRKSNALALMRAVGLEV